MPDFVGKLLAETERKQSQTRSGFFLLFFCEKIRGNIEDVSDWKKRENKEFRSSEMRIDMSELQKKIVYTNNISVEDYNGLRKSVDWISVTEKRAWIALHNSFYLCVAMYGEEPIGMVRIISDGGYSYFITDVIVKPGFQGEKVGTELISRALDYIQKDVLEGETVMISLMSAYQKEPFYDRFGFHRRPFGNHGSGMSVWVSRDKDGNVTTS